MDELKAEFAALIARVRQGDADAIRELYESYNDAVQRVVRRRLHPSLRRQFDSLDFSQAVWMSFVQLPASQLDFDTPAAFVGFLGRMASNKVINVLKQHQGPMRRALNEMTSLDDLLSKDTKKTVGDLLPAPTPTASQVVIAEERWQQLMERVPPGHRRVLELLRDGYPKHEISERLNIHPKVMQRLLAQLREISEEV